MNVSVRLQLAAVLALWQCGASAQSWHLTTAPSNDWTSVACSADGRTVFACAGPNGDRLIYVSTNAGANWTASSAPVWSWFSPSVVCSADGTRAYAAYPLGGIWKSTDAGLTWALTAATTTNRWVITCSAEGEMILACDSRAYRYPGGVCFSEDAGTNWRCSWPEIVVDWTSATCSSGGKYWAAAADYPALYVSSDFGATWSPREGPVASLTSIACSASGGLLIAAGKGGIYTSSDWGGTWLPTSAPALEWAAVDSSADAKRVVAAAKGHPIYHSADSGATWVQSESPATNWQAVACSADGYRFVAAVRGGGIYSSETTPQLSLGVSRAGDDRVSVSWVAPSAEFVLQQTPSLAHPEWKSVDAQPALNYTNLNQEVSLPVPSGAMFYRLASR